MVAQGGVFERQVAGGQAVTKSLAQGVQIAVLSEQLLKTGPFLGLGRCAKS